MTISSYVSVNSVNIPLSGTTGAVVTSGSSIIVKLVNPAGVQSWNISCTGVDEITSAAAVNATLVQDNTTWTATFTAPTTSSGSTMIFNSITNQGLFNQSQFSFGAFIQLDGYRLFASGEDSQSNATVGNVADLNKLVRSAALGGGGGGGFLAGGDLSGTSTDQTVIAVQGHAISSTAPSEGQFLVEGASSWAPTSLSGDVGASVSTPGLLTVKALQGHSVSTQTLGSGQDGYVLTWDNTDGYYKAKVAPSSLGYATIEINTTPLAAGTSLNFESSGASSVSGSTTGSTTTVVVSSQNFIPDLIRKSFLNTGDILLIQGKLQTVLFDQTGGQGTYHFPDVSDSFLSDGWSLILTDATASWGANPPIFVTDDGSTIELPDTPGSFATSITSPQVNGVSMTYTYGATENAWLLTSISYPALSGDLSGTPASIVVSSAHSGLLSFTSTGKIISSSTATDVGLTQDSISTASIIAPNMNIAAATATGSGSQGGTVVIGSGNGVSQGGFIFLSAGTGTIDGYIGFLTANALSFSIGNSNNGGDAQIFLGKAVANPTGAVTAGGILYVDHSTGNLMFIGSSGTARLVASA